MKAVIFDYGGVLGGGSENFYRVLSNFLSADLSTTSEEARKLVPQFQKGIINETQFWYKLTYRLKLPLPANYLGKMQTWYSANHRFNEDMLHLSDRMRQKGYRTAVLSNTIPPHLSIWRSHIKTRGFSPVIASCEVGMRKPEERIYRLAMEKLRIGKDEGVYIDDEEEFLQPARKVGLIPVLALDAKQVEVELRE
ncbi:MAG: HAD family phosphatase, partial [Candidatus Aenigmarchaeota archaeon]|nr:HAD family phosphatase [Candidatus Aenigmarchaeota archaeon]